MVLAACKTQLSCDASSHVSGRTGRHTGPDKASCSVSSPLHRVRRRSTAGLRASVNDRGRRAAWKYSGRHRHLQRVEITHLTLPAQKASVQSFEHVKVIQDNGQPDSCLPKGRNRLSLRSQSEDGTKIRRLWPAARCRTALLQAHAAHGSIPNSQKCLRQHCPACSCRSDYFRAARH